MTADPLAAAGLPDLTGVVRAHLADQAHQYPLLFATVSGAHLYGFPSSDSDVDIRAVHLLPLTEVVGLRTGPQTLVHTEIRDGMEIDLVSHDLAKFARMLLRRNGYVAEQLLSPLVVHTTGAHAAMVRLAPGFLTRHHAHHYLGFARNQWNQFGRNGELKSLLYTFRVLLTGVHLMRTGKVVAHLPTLVEEYRAPAYLSELIAAKATGEHHRYDEFPDRPSRHRLSADVTAWQARLDYERDRSGLPEVPSAEPALHDLLCRERLATSGRGQSSPDSR